MAVLAGTYSLIFYCFIVAGKLVTTGDVECNPGPQSWPCGWCGEECTWAQKSVDCDSCDAQVPACVNATVWVGVPEDDYDMSYASINDPNGRPLGFARSTIPYITEGKPNPCIRISGSITGKRLEVMAESNPTGSSICVSRDGRNMVCQNSGIYLCEQPTSDTVNYVFHCTGESCDQSDVPFFYRFTVGPPDDSDPELWCDAQDTDEYPRTLIPLPPMHTMPPQPKSTTPSGASTMVHCSTLLMMVICRFLSLLFHV